jgi:putative (di)nucleoside polyphosphate hydrolase
MPARRTYADPALWQTPVCRMSDVIDRNGFRANVGIVLTHDGQVFFARRTGGRGWQFPQGGVRSGETLEEALFRELGEEIGLEAPAVELLGQTGRWLRYRLPARYVRRNQHPLCIGQKQRWFLLRLKDEEAAFDLGRTSEPEFDQWRWVSYWEPVKEVIYFKRRVYARALSELAPLAFRGGAQPPLPPWWDRVTAQAQRDAAASTD